MTTDYRVHVRNGERWQIRAVPLVAIHEGYEEDGTLFLAVVPDVSNNNRLQAVPFERTALCFDSCRICRNEEHNRRPQVPGKPLVARA